MRIGIMIILKTNNHMRSTLKATFAVFTTILMTAVSCNKEIAETQNPLLEKHTCEMKLVGSLVNFDGPDTRADANTTTWADGSIIYLRMNSPLGITTGEAVYNASKDVWTISYYGSLYEEVANSCSALYLENKVSYDNTLFTMNERTAIYEALDGSYIYDGGDLVVTANLKPKTGRIRFSGSEGTTIKVYGITHYNSYCIDTDTYLTSNNTFNLTVGKDGYTPYIYGIFTETAKPNVKLWIDAKEAYTRFCSDEVFNAGQSGKFTIPTAESHNGWAEGLYFYLDDAQFKMVAVKGGTFTMGDPLSTNEYYTAHDVTLTGYCIGETEITYEVRGKMYGSTFGSNYKNKPYGFTRTEILSFIDKLNTSTNSYFTLPTEAQWEFAAKGGVNSKGYKYSGSDNIDDVAWYRGNCSDKMDVKQKLQNELGLYDMSGNALEWTRDTYAPYSSANVKDPIISTNGNQYSVRGGSDSRDSNFCTTIYREHYGDGTGGIGGRLVLNWD